EVEKVVEAVEGALARVFLRLDRLAFGLSLGITSGLLLFLATIILVLKGGGAVGPNLQLLSQYFPGYSVTLSGSVLGLGYGFVSGFVAGGGFAFLRITTLFLYMAFVRRLAEWHLLSQFFIGYRVTFVGSLIGFTYAFALGFVLGYLVAKMYNWIAGLKEGKRLGHT